MTGGSFPGGQVAVELCCLSASHPATAPLEPQNKACGFEVSARDAQKSEALLNQKCSVRRLQVFLFERLRAVSSMQLLLPESSAGCRAPLSREKRMLLGPW